MNLTRCLSLIALTFPVLTGCSFGDEDEHEEGADSALTGAPSPDKERQAREDEAKRAETRQQLPRLAYDLYRALPASKLFAISVNSKACGYPTDRPVVRAFTFAAAWALPDVAERLGQAGFSGWVTVYEGPVSADGRSDFTLVIEASGDSRRGTCGAVRALTCTSVASTGPSPSQCGL